MIATKFFFLGGATKIKFRPNISDWPLDQEPVSVMIAFSFLYYRMADVAEMIEVVLQGKDGIENKMWCLPCESTGESKPASR